MKRMLGKNLMPKATKTSVHPSASTKGARSLQVILANFSQPVGIALRALSGIT